MKQKIIAIILALALALSLPGGTLAAEGDARQTDFADMEYKHIEPEPILAQIGEARELLDDAANAERVEELYEQISDDYQEMFTMTILVTIRSDQDIWDEEAVAENIWCTERNTLVSDAILALIRDILNSPCGAFLAGRLGPEGAEELGQYEEMTDRQRELSAREIALESEYNMLAS